MGLTRSGNLVGAMLFWPAPLFVGLRVSEGVLRPSKRHAPQRRLYTRCFAAAHITQIYGQFGKAPVANSALKPT